MNYINISAKNRKKGKELSPAPFRLRGNYIANTKDNHEKIELFWTVHCLSGEDIADIDLINKEIEIIQAQNTRATASNSLHVALTLPEGESLSEEAWREAETMLSEALGLSEHQRVVALHKDTKDSHLHIAYNLIHPETFKKHFPENDFEAGSKVCRTIEQKYGLRRDVGFREATTKDSRSVGAKDMEAHTHHESFESYVLKNKDALLKGIKEAKDWHDVHEVFTQHDLKLKKHGAGLVITQGKNRMKASTLDRSYSKNALEKRFGAFKPKSRDHKKTASSRKKYGLTPLARVRGDAQKWGRFLGLRKKDQPLLTWKDYLMLEAGFDPLAMVIIKANQSMLRGLRFTESHAPLPMIYPKRKNSSNDHPDSIDKAQQMGAFEETALSLKDALESTGTKKKDKGFDL